METGTIAMVAIGLALFAVFGLFVALMCVMIEGSWSAVRWYLGILVLGYGGDVVERLRLPAVWAGITAGVKSLFHRDEGVYEALDL